MEWITLMVRSVLEKKPDASRIHRLYDSAIREHSALIDRICFGYANSLYDLDDLKQDAMLNLWESMNLFKGDCSMKTWVYRITLNTCVSSLRKRYRSISTVELTSLYDTVDYDVERKQVITDLHEAIATLNPIDKAIVLLWLEEESYEEISQITGLSVNNVGVRLHRAKSKLKQFAK
ncbi:MAG: RNA polymerase sigma factor [Muribaculaceae bacterium]|nr:RNA polymerase sigma factor [Muribaculaceae bacterium]